ESETTSATLGKTGIRKFNLMANLDFLSIPMGKYIQNHLNFAQDLEMVPIIFGVNYFLKDERGNYLTDIQDKRVWLKWMEKRVHKELPAIKTPIGFIPYYEDLKELFQEVLSKNFPKSVYLDCFTLRINQNLAKIERIKKTYQDLKNIPEKVFKILEEQRERLEKAKRLFGESIPPEKFIS
ncbi:MAG: phosphoenolpyruvate carboxykinase, partial [Candidatus Omnitrophota bacterium]